MVMKKKLISFLLVHCFLISAEEKKDFGLFENYWKKQKINFASLSEVSNPEITEENTLKYSAFMVRCMRGYDHSIIIFTGRRKTVYVCSENKDKVDAYMKDEQEFFKQNLRDTAEVIKQGNVCLIQKLGETKDRCFIAARRSSELQKIDPLHLGYIVMNWAQDEAEGIFSVEGCDIKVSQVYHEGAVDLEQMYPSKK
jgi:hypothetical protein